MRKFVKFIHNTLTVAREKSVIFLAERLMKKEDGSYIPYLFLTLPLGPTRLQKFLFVACPEMSREILHHDVSPKCPVSSFDRGWLAPVFQDELGETMFTAQAPQHKKLRTHVSEYFRRGLDKRFGENLFRQTEALIEEWTSKERVNATQTLSSYTSQAIVENFIGDVPNTKALHEAMKTILNNMSRRFRLQRPLPKKKVQEARQVMHEMAVGAAKLGRDSLLKQMAKAGFSPEEIEGMARFLFLAGQETVSSALPPLLFHCNEEYQECVRKEFGERDHSPASILQFCKNSKWISALINETLRLFPPAYALNRVCRKTVTIKGIRIPKNCAIIPFVLFFQRDTQFWGEDAAIFRPNRWLEGMNEKAPFMPFGIGPNHCLGQPFARLEMGLFLAMMCLKTSWTTFNETYEYNADFSLSSKEDIVISATPLPLSPLARN